MENEPNPIFSDDLAIRGNPYDLPAYREYWDGRRWCVGEYVYLTGEPEVDNFIGGEDAQSQMGGGQAMATPQPTERTTEGGVQRTDMEQPQE